MLLKFDNYRAYLKALVSDKISKNSSLSLRSIARHLGIAQSFLSEIISGRKSLSNERAHEIAEKLGLSGTSKEYFCALVQFENATESKARQAIETHLETIRRMARSKHISSESFDGLSDWYHYAILEMTVVDHPPLTPKEFSLRLGLPLKTVQSALTCLVDAGYLKVTEHGYSKAQAHLLATSKTSSGALKKFHTQMLEKGRLAIDLFTPARRYTASETFAFSPEQLDEAAEITEEFFTRMIQLANRSKTKEFVYHLSVNLFPLEQVESKESPRS